MSLLLVYAYRWPRARRFSGLLCVRRSTPTLTPNSGRLLQRSCGYQASGGRMWDCPLKSCAGYPVMARAPTVMGILSRSPLAPLRTCTGLLQRPKKMHGVNAGLCHRLGARQPPVASAMFYFHPVICCSSISGMPDHHVEIKNNTLLPPRAHAGFSGLRVSPLATLTR